MKKSLIVLFSLGLCVSSYARLEDQEPKNEQDHKKTIVQEMLQLHESMHVMVLAAGLAANVKTEQAEIAAGGSASKVIRQAMTGLISYVKLPASSFGILGATFGAANACARLDHGDVEAIAQAAYKAMRQNEEEFKSYAAGIHLIQSPEEADLRKSIETLLSIEIAELSQVIPEIRIYFVDKVSAILKIYLNISQDEGEDLKGQLSALAKAVGAELKATSVAK